MNKIDCAQNKLIFTKDWIWIIVTILIIIAVLSINLLFTPNSIPKIGGIRPSDINSRFRVFTPEGANTFSTQDVTIRLEIDIVGSDTIAFESDYGARIFIFTDGEWKEVKNFMEYPEGPNIVLPSKGDPMKMRGTAVSPILQDPSEPINVRIFLVGNIYRDGQITDERTAAYVDVHLHP